MSILSLILFACGSPQHVESAPAPAPAKGAEQAKAPVEHVDAQGAAKLVEAGEVRIVDVRTPPEFQAGHLEGAINVDFNSPDFADRVAKLPRDKPILLHCQSGRRSTAALPVFEKNGFARIYHLDGGFGAWASAGLPVVK